MRIIDVRVTAPYTIWIRFADGVEGEVDLSPLLQQGVFRQLLDPAMFARVAVDPVTHTVAWPNGIDLCPDALYQDIVHQHHAA